MYTDPPIRLASYPEPLRPLLQSLADERQRFVNDHAIESLFATAYFHSTVRILDPTVQQKLLYPEIVVREIELFYALYAKNKTQIQPHWRRYYHEARRLQRQLELRSTDDGVASASLGLALTRLLNLAMEAHITVDLTSALNQLFRETELTKAQLQPDFYFLDRVFPQSLNDTLRDIDRATGSFGAFRPARAPLQKATGWLLHQLGSGDRAVANLRHRAWKAALDPA